MGRKSPTSQIFASAHHLRSSEPVGLEREIVKRQQVRHDTETIVWGDYDALPMVILDAINKSPTATTCINKVAGFMKGSGFTDTNLMNLVIDSNGTKFGDFHAKLCEYMAKLEGFSVRFTYNYDLKITNAFILPVQSVRFKKPEIEQSKEITCVKYNPYFGTQLFKKEDSKEYYIYNKDTVQAEIEECGTKYGGQVYFHGSVRAPYTFYPVPKYWAGEHWIYTDAYVQSFVKELLENGFFQSVLLNMIGDPTQASKNPKYQREVVGTDGVKRKEPDGTTVGEEFSKMMQDNFSGHKKAGTAMVLWSASKEATPNISSFPVNANFDQINGTMNNAIRGITIATEVPAILANLPQQGSSLGSDGDSMRAAVELMQGRVRDEQNMLESFYNEVLLPNLANAPAGAEVKIKPLGVFSNQVVVPDKVWEWMNDAEKAEFVKSNVPNVTVMRSQAAQDATQTTVPQQTADNTPAQNDALKGLKVAEINRVQSIVRKYENGSMSYDQAKQLIMSYGFNEEQTAAWLKPQDTPA